MTNLCKKLSICLCKHLKTLIVESICWVVNESNFFLLIVLFLKQQQILVLNMTKKYKYVWKIKNKLQTSYLERKMSTIWWEEFNEVFLNTCRTIFFSCENWEPTSQAMDAKVSHTYHVPFLCLLPWPHHLQQVNT